jgi:glycosyltransferase involved in cell wall biosynthesis
VLPPTISPEAGVEGRSSAVGPLRALFVGRNFARKGGVAILRAAQELARTGKPVHFTLVSSLVVGDGAHADARDRRLYENDLRLLDLPNVTWLKEASNARVRELMRESDVLLLPTLYDTYGYSVLEGYSCGIPSVTTNVCALPEIVVAGETGCVLDLPVGENNMWTGIHRVEETGDWDLLTSTYNDLARKLVDTMAALAEDRQRVTDMGRAALRRLRTHHDPVAAARVLLSAYGATSEDLPMELASLLDDDLDVPG